jgi:protein O-GlcNAc transferase
MSQIEEAISCYKTAIKIKPDNAVALANLAAAYKDSGQLSEAIRFYQDALELKPNFDEAFCNLIHTLVFICDWTTREEDFIRLSQVNKFTFRKCRDGFYLLSFSASVMTIYICISREIWILK